MTVFPNELEPTSYRDMAETVTQWVQSHPQLCSSKHNRLLHQCKLYTESKGIIQKTHPNWLSFIQGLKDIQEYWFIIKVFGNQLLEEPLFEPLTLSLQDPNLPQDSKAGTPGRDTQFELFIAAIAARTGLSVDRLGDGQADWLLDVSGKKWSLEAKRIKKLERMEKHIRKAGKQIVASNVGGVIAIDISLAVNPNCDPLPRFTSEDEIQKAHRMRTDCFMQRFLPSIREWCL